ncbi:DEAD/DEAH box helicase [Romboutsia weinsteinii]|uniref:DEAD/DEAH box helicase n=1 Tax=Romboutsia weinsteinii TaxID=2020949 RepID=A0A371J8E5_9FIRM|nr:DEAD/DEAH box helicase [Romboutsia weinsteinii]RDY28983.1 DEAD/DEAH box helicase [Romboutsia weinsteinii]
MNLIIIEDIIKNNTEKSRFNSGFTSYKRNLVINDYANIEGDVITFYGTVIDEYHRQNYTSLIMINQKTRAILNINCDCNDCISKNNKPQICAHIVATALKGFDALKHTNDNEEISEGVTIIPEVTLNISQSRGGYLGLDLDIFGVDKIEYRRIFNSYKENKKLHRLSNGSYLDLKDEHLVKAFDIIDILGVFNDFENIKIPNNKAIFLDSLIQEEDLNFVNGSKYIKNISKKYKTIPKEKYIVPSTLNAKLRDYQIDGFNYFKTLAHFEFGGILADEMGLGKTIQAITFLLSQENKKSIVITPTSLIHNWKNEFDKFAPSLNIGIVHGNKRDRENILINVENYDVILTTYSTFRNDLEKYDNKIFDYCFIDEAQNIKNPDSSITKTIKEINAKIRFALTGTPIENNLLELWSIFDFVMPGYLYNQNKFKSIFINNEKNINSLKSLIKPFMLRRTKKEVIEELPDKIEQKYYIELVKDHRIAYNSYVKLIKQRIKENSQDNMTIFSYLTKLRQLTLAPEIMVKNYNGDNTKIDVLLELIKDNTDKKILVFSQFTKVLKLIEDNLIREDISYSYLDGKTSAPNRVKLVEEFNTSNEKQVFLISLKAGGTGLNLTSASMVVHFDPWWNPAVEDQASDRAHRIGQKNAVNVIKLVAKDTVEGRVIELQESKKDLIDDIIDGNLDNSSVLKGLSKDDIVDLFI